MNVSIGHVGKDKVVQDLAGLDDLTKGKMQHLIKISTHVFEGTTDGELVCVWGLVAPSIISDQAYLWLYCTEALDEHKFLFIRHSQRWLEKALLEFPLIVGYCMDDNARAMRWLKWLGARFEAKDNLGRRKFEIVRATYGS